MNYVLDSGTLRAEVSPLGAELISLRCDGTEYLWQGDPAYWDQRSPLLFPFVGRFTEGKYLLRGKSYPMTIHGFASRLLFEAETQNSRELVLAAADSEETREIYPYRFLLKVRYRLAGLLGAEEAADIGKQPAGSLGAEKTVNTGKRLAVCYEVENRSEEDMFFGIGGHPGFRVPREAGERFEDYFLDFGLPHRPARVGHTPACFLSGSDTEFPLEEGRYLPLRHEMFDEDAIVLKNMVRKVCLRSHTSPYTVTLEYPDMPYLGIWHRPHTEAPYVCIEPWTSLPSRQDIVEEFTAKSDLVRLPAGRVYRNEWYVELKGGEG